MKKKMLFVMATIAAFTLFVPSVWAAEVDSDLAAAVNAATDGDTLTLTKDIEVTSVITIDEELTLDLAGFDVLFKNNSYLLVEGGNLTVTGEGKMAEETPYYAPILVKGSTDSTATNYSVVAIGEDVCLEGWAGVFVRQNSTNTAYGVNITVNGTIESLKDEEGVTGHGVYVNGSIKHTTNAPVITLGETAVITSEGTGIYAAGYAVWNINGATITGVENGLAIKSGKINITGGTITATGEDLRPTESYNNGVNPSGAAIQIESNKGYAGNIELNISGGTFVSENSVAVYEYLALGDENDTTDDTSETSVSNISISGGSFESFYENFDVSDSFNDENTGFVTGGTFDDLYVEEGYLSTEEDYVVTGEGEVILESDAVYLTMIGVVDGKVVENSESTVAIKKGYKLSDEDLADFELIEKDINETFEEDGFVFLGFFTDKEGKDKVDFTKALDSDATWYMVVGEKVEELPPKTGDINLVVLIGTILVGMAGMAIVIRKRFAKCN